jgi:CCR4-NOT transcription complex subunit 4
LAPAPAPAVAAAPPPPKAAPIKPVATSKKEKKKAVAAASAKKDEVVAEEKKSDPEPVEKQKTVDTAPAASKVKEESSSKRQGPLMMRILSKDSSASSSALPTPTATAKAESVLQFSDTASIGTSESRPVSPPPASETAQKKKKEQPLMGPALADVPLVVTKTKSAIKKEKQDQRKKEIEAAELAAARLAEVQAPIQGRAKKAKKSGKKPSSSTSSAPATQQQQQQQQQPENNNNTNEDTASSRPESLIDEQQQQQQQQQPPEPKTAAQLIAELGLDLRDYEMLKPNVVGLKWEHHISAEDVAKIRASLPPPGSSPESPQFHVLPGSDPSSVHLSLRGGGSFETRMLVTPAGSVLRGLTPQQEKRYLEMEERRRHEKSWERWGGAEYPIEKTADWKAATMAAGLAAAGSVARHMHLGGDDAQRLSTKEALDYLWNTVMPALPGYAQEHLEGLAKSMEAGGCRVSVGFEDAAVPTDSSPSPSDSSSPPQHHAEDALVTVDVKVENPAAPTMTTTTTPSQYGVLELEKMVMAARKETEALEKKCEKLVKRNRKIVGLV